VGRRKITWNYPASVAFPKVSIGAKVGKMSFESISYWQQAPLSRPPEFRQKLMEAGL
jgi:hypothetical protein